MADQTGFLKYDRALPPRRPVELRLMDWKDVYTRRENGEDPLFPTAEVRTQAARYMDCGIPFCHHACPVANLIPEWNDLAGRDLPARPVQGPREGHRADLVAVTSKEGSRG